MKVRITLTYVPDEPDPDDDTGMSEPEHDLLSQLFIEHGLEIENIEVVSPPEPPPERGRLKRPK